VSSPQPDHAPAAEAPDPAPTPGTEAVVTDLDDIAVAVVGYRDPDRVPADRVDIIDRRRLVEVASLTRADAIRLADRLCEVASSDDPPVQARLIRDAAVAAIENAAAALQGHDIQAARPDFDLLVAELAVAALDAAAVRLRELGADLDSTHRSRPGPPPTPPNG
jgi:hypothetical protein